MLNINALTIFCTAILSYKYTVLQEMLFKGYFPTGTYLERLLHVLSYLYMYCPTGVTLQVLPYRFCPTLAILLVFSNSYCPNVQQVLSHRHYPTGALLHILTVLQALSYKCFPTSTVLQVLSYRYFLQVLSLRQTHTGTGCSVTTCSQQFFYKYSQ